MSVVDKVNANWQNLLEPWGGALDMTADTADRAAADRPISSAFGIASALVANVDANAESRLASEGLAAMKDGAAGMERWANSMLAPRAGRMGYDVNIMNEANSPFSKGLVERWKWLGSEVVARMPLEARRAYEEVLNAKMRESLQETMYNDDQADEYKAVSFREYSATGEGKVVKVELSDATRKKADEFQRLQGEAEAKAPSSPTAIIDRWVAIAEGRPDPEADPTKLAVKSFEAKNPGFVGFDAASSKLYFGDKLDASKRFAAQYAPELRMGITSALMGKRYGLQWLVSELGYDFGTKTFAKLDGADHPHADSVVKRWDKVKSDQLARMPAFLQERFDGYANSALSFTLEGAMHADRKIGKYGDVKTHLWSSKGETDEYRFFLDGNGKIQAEVVPKEQDCITQIILPIVAAVCMIIPGTQALGATLASMTLVGGVTAATAMTAVGAGLSVGLAINNGIETGDWLGAVASVAGTAFGVGGLGGGLGSAMGLAKGTMSTLSTIGTIGTVAKGAYGLYQGIESGNPWAALSGAATIAGAGFGPNGAGLVDKNTSGLLNGASTFMRGTSALGAGIQGGSPFALANGALTLTGLAGAAGSKAENDVGSMVSDAARLGIAGAALAAQGFGAANGGSIDPDALAGGTQQGLTALGLEYKPPQGYVNEPLIAAHVDNALPR